MIQVEHRLPTPEILNNIIKILTSSQFHLNSLTFRKRWDLILHHTLFELTHNKINKYIFNPFFIYAHLTPLCNTQAHITGRTLCTDRDPPLFVT